MDGSRKRTSTESSTEEPNPLLRNEKGTGNRDTENVSSEAGEQTPDIPYSVLKKRKQDITEKDEDMDTNEHKIIEMQKQILEFKVVMEEPTGIDHDSVEVPTTRARAQKETDLYKRVRKFCEKVVAILHVVDDYEQLAVINKMDPPVLFRGKREPFTDMPIEHNEQNGIVLGMFGGYECAVVQTRKDDPTTDIEKDFPNAKAIIALGTAAAANTKEIQLGDVLVSTSILHQINNTNVFISKHLVDVFAKPQDNPVWPDFIVNKNGRPSKVHSGLIINNKNEWSQCSPIETELEAIGVEAGGYCEFLRTRDLFRKLDVVVIKGVASYTSIIVDKKWQPKAVEAAVDYTLHKLKGTNGNLFQAVKAKSKKVSENDLLPSVFKIRSSLILHDILSDEVESEEYVYPHQRAAVLAAKDFFDNGPDVNIALIVLPTGCGKTGVAVLSAYALAASRVLVITPSQKISSQILKNFCDPEENFLMKRRILENKPGIYQNYIPNGKLIEKSAQIRTSKTAPLMITNAHKVGGKSSIAIDEIPSDGYDLVIVDEAHHYPADTWRILINHFEKSKRLFLTATPYHKGKPICYLPDDESPHDGKEIPICFSVSREEAIANGTIRRLSDFVEVGENKDETDSEAMNKVATKVKKMLDLHNQQDPKIKHQAMILAQQIETGSLNAAEDIAEVYGDDCEIFTSKSKRDGDVVKRFDNHQFSTLVIVGKLLEGYDNCNVSVLAIVRNVAPASRVFFAQFIGRAVRKAHPNDPVSTVVISHVKYQQQKNFSQFEMLAENEDYDYD